MKNLFQQLAAYNTWANQKLGETIITLPNEICHQEVQSSFASLHQTLLHMWNAESIWWQRLRLQENVIPAGQHFQGDTTELLQHLLQQNKLWESWINTCSEMALEHVVKYHNTKREPFKQPTYQLLLQIFNHGTYHRGQLVNILRQLGQTKIPGTDFISWTRRK